MFTQEYVQHRMILMNIKTKSAMHDLEHCSIPDTVHFVQGMKSDVSSQAEAQSSNKPLLLYL